MKLSRTTVLGLIAGLSMLSSVAAQDGPWTVSRVLMALCGAGIAFLGAFAGDHAAPVIVPPPQVPQADKKEGES